LDEVRDGGVCNPARRAIVESGDPCGRLHAVVAAMLIFLNRTGYKRLFPGERRANSHVLRGALRQSEI